jgi:DNA-binding MarR family transcriptional regulator
VTPSAAEDRDRARRALTSVWQGVRGRVRDAAREHGLTFPQAMCLKFLGERGPCMASDLAAELAATPGNVTGVLDRLEEQGLVVRRRDEQDRRALRLELTPKGQRLVRAFEAEVTAALDDAFGQLKPSELRTLVGLLERMAPQDEKPLARAARRASR